jgi:hypothetical protein
VESLSTNADEVATWLSEGRALYDHAVVKFWDKNLVLEK